ncbi:MAG: patatin-like phospholipase family protein [Lachnospiraceae bacterium]|nr:patatin-like phospholipase family protein [Lachnospiraceae bacterium]
MVRIGLLLSGGMAKGAYQIGALEAISEWIKASEFEYVAGSSIGALNSYAFLTGNLSKAKDMWKDLGANEDIKWILKAMKKSFVEKVVGDIYVGGDFPAHFSVPLLETCSRKLKYVDLSSVPEADVEKYLLASVAMPVYCKPVEIGNEAFYDGAMVDNIPVKSLADKDLDYIICIYFDTYNYMFENEEFNNKCIKLAFNDNTFISNSIVVSEERTKFMLETGYEKGKEILGEFFKNGTDDLEYIYGQIARYNAENANVKRRVTGDFIVDNINKVTKHIFRHNK